LVISLHLAGPIPAAIPIAVAILITVRKNLAGPVPAAIPIAVTVLITGRENLAGSVPVAIPIAITAPVFRCLRHAHQQTQSDAEG